MCNRKFLDFLPKIARFIQAFPRETDNTMAQNYSTNVSLNSSDVVNSPQMGKPAQNGSLTQQFLFPYYAEVLFYIIQCILVVFGLLGNVLVILSVRRNPHMKKSISNLFIQNLAIADIGVLTLSHTFILGLEIKNFVWPFGEFFCRVIYPLSDSFYGVSIMSIVAISFHRLVDDGDCGGVNDDIDCDAVNDDIDCGATDDDDDHDGIGDSIDYHDSIG